MSDTGAQVTSSEETPKTDVPETGAYVYQARVKEHLSKKGFKSTGEFIDLLNIKVQKLLDEAANRCKANGRNVVSGRDL